MPDTPADPRAPLLRDLLRRAGDAALARGRAPAVRRKADGSRVTDADLASEAVIVEGLRAAFPDDAVRTEETVGFAVGDAHAHATWFVDPVDGTGALIEGLPTWGPTVCRVVDGALDVGALWMPRTREWWFAAAGRGAWRDDVRLQAQDPGLRGDSTLLVPSGAHGVGPLRWPGKVRSLGSTATHLALVAAGGCAATVVGRWSTWDVGCGVLLVREAGRVVVDLSGRPFDPIQTPDRPFLAAAPSAVDPLVAMLAGLALRQER